MKTNPIKSIALASLLLAAAAHAGLHVYEPFNYSVGSLTGRNGGIGFASGWEKAVPDAGGYVWDETTNLQYGTQTPILNWNGVLNNGFPALPSTGARYGGADPAQPPTGSSNLAIYRNLSSSAGALAGADGVLWMSAVYHVVGTSFGGGIHLGLGSGHIYERGRSFPTTTTDFVGASGYTGASNVWNAELRAVVVDDSNGTGVGWTDFSRSATGIPLSTTKDMIVVLKFTFSPTSDTVDAFFFNEDTSLDAITETAFDAGKVSTTFAAGIDENSLTVLSSANSRFGNAYDEIRIGDTFTDVVTLPPPGAVNADMSIVSASPVAAPADGTTTATITVTLTDAIGVPIQGKNVSLANTSGPMAATISPSGTLTTNSSGQATFTVKSTTAGIEVFTATDVSDSNLVITQTASVTFVSSADADLSTVAASPTLVKGDGTATSTITVSLKATGGVPVPGKQVTLAGSPGNATIDPLAPVTTDANGVATFAVKSSTPGTKVFTATDVTDSNLVITQTASVNFFGPGNAGLSTVAAAHASVVANGITATTITVTLKDANGFVVEGKDVTLAGIPASADIDPASAVTNVSGVATFSVSSSTVGTVVFTATDTTDSVIISQTASVNFVDAAIPLAINFNVYNSAGTPVQDDLALLEGPAPDSGLGDTWNQSNATTASNLLSSTGVLTSVGISCNASGRWAVGNPADALKILRAGAAQFDKATPSILTITGLAPDSFFDVFLASTRTDGVEPNTGTWSTTHETLSSNSQAVSNIGNPNGTTWVAGNNFVAFEKVKVNGSGQLVFSGASGVNRLFLNGLQLVPTGPPLALITSFGIPGWPGVIDQTAKTIALTVPAGTNLATLAPTFTLYSGTCNQTSGAPPSPTFAVQNPATYTVTDTSTVPATVNTYTVKVTVNAAVGSLVINLGTSPVGTEIKGGTFIGSGPTHLPLPPLPPGSTLRSITVNTKLEATDNQNYASDLTVLLDPTPGNPGGDFSVGITTAAAAVDFGEVLTLNWADGAGDGGVGTSLVDTKTDTAWATTGVIDLATTGLFLGNGMGAAPAGGTWSGTITLTYDIVGSGSAYQSWAGTEEFDSDKNGDGVANGLAFLLGAAGPNAGALGLLPEVSKTASGLVLTFSVLNAASRGPALASVQWSNDLGQADPWAGNSAAVPETTSVVNGVSFQVTPNGGLNDVVATIPSTEAAAGKLFGRLSGTEN